MALWKLSSSKLLIIMDLADRWEDIFSGSELGWVLNEREDRSEMRGGYEL
jgi:hypothetical protein